MSIEVASPQTENSNENKLESAYGYVSTKRGLRCVVALLCVTVDSAHGGLSRNKPGKEVRRGRTRGRDRIRMVLWVGQVAEMNWKLSRIGIQQTKLAMEPDLFRRDSGK
jgi:hypothetical protein